MGEKFSIRRTDGYQLYEGTEAISHVRCREYLLEKDKNELFTVLLPLVVTDDTVKCQVIKREQTNYPWYLLDDMVQKAPFRIGHDMEIDIKKELSENSDKYIRIVKIEEYKGNEESAWPSWVDWSAPVWMKFDPKDGGGYCSKEYLIWEVHHDYVIVIDADDPDQEIKCSRLDLNKTWFREQWYCDQYAQWLTKKERGMLGEDEQEFILREY